jgi:hypothetical protein
MPRGLGKIEDRFKINVLLLEAGIGKENNYL